MTNGRHHRAKLTEKQVRKIRDLHAGGQSQRKLAARFKVTQACVSQIVLWATWRHL